MRRAAKALDGRSLAAIALATAILLTSATQLRIAGTPIGPGEAALAGCIVVLVVWTARLAAVCVGPLTRPWLLFWAIALAALAMGWVIGIVSGESIAASNRDAVAYVFCAVVVGVLVVQPMSEDLIEDALFCLILEAALVIGGLFVLGLASNGRVGPIQIWYEAIRFRAWAANPNQLALLLVPLPWFAFALRHRGRRSGLLLIGSAVVLAGLGFATGSDALLVSWAIGSLIWAGWLVVSAAARPTRSVRRAAVARVIIPLAILFAAIVEGPSAMAWVEDRGFRIYFQGGQGPDRVARWGFGLEVLAASPVVGFGPGSFSGRSSAFAAEEAHNTPVDWATSTGSIGLTALAFLELWVVSRCIRARSRLATLAVLSLIAFMGLHYMLRQPITWFYLLAASAMRPRPDPAPEAGG